VDGWLPDLVRLGELGRHLSDGVIEEIAAEGTRTVEPRAARAATRGRKLWPHQAGHQPETGLQADKEHETRNTPEHHKH
jgi:hypothetical protein